MTKHFSTTNNSNLQLPEEGATMKIKNFKDMMMRPYSVNADFECSLIKTTRKDGKTHEHQPNSAAFYFVCTHGPSRNDNYKYNGDDCAVQMIKNERASGKMQNRPEKIIKRCDSPSQRRRILEEPNNAACVVKDLMK